MKNFDGKLEDQPLVERLALGSTATNFIVEIKVLKGPDQSVFLYC